MQPKESVPNIESLDDSGKFLKRAKSRRERVAEKFGFRTLDLTGQMKSKESKRDLKNSSNNNNRPTARSSRSDKDKKKSLQKEKEKEEAAARKEKERVDAAAAAAAAAASAVAARDSVASNGSEDENRPKICQRCNEGKVKAVIRYTNSKKRKCCKKNAAQCLNVCGFLFFFFCLFLR